jgi:hypothetical protein
MDKESNLMVVAGPKLIVLSKLKQVTQDLLDQSQVESQLSSQLGKL